MFRGDTPRKGTSQKLILPANFADFDKYIVYIDVIDRDCWTLKCINFHKCIKLSTNV